MQNAQNGNIVSIQVWPLCCDNEETSCECLCEYLFLSHASDFHDHIMLNVYRDKTATHLDLYGMANMASLPTKVANVTTWHSFQQQRIFVNETFPATIQGSFHNPCEAAFHFETAEISVTTEDQTLLNNIDRRYFSSCTLSHRYAWGIDSIAQPYSTLLTVSEVLVMPAPYHTTCRQTFAENNFRIFHKWVFNHENCAPQTFGAHPYMDTCMCTCAWWMMCDGV